ncbi:Ultraviolet-B receptor UVR8 [Apostasia shenzhenica]|uniref:Ultraviolet-B receptor UVR8 n=1 Tax=Apostasia shenzhenica TaxID=1088818 RepID=A0A2H9ZZQ4_9ASPA|nr:Ultraviolet-B receptor UVR8 [Apostasia shenzhenica]
MSAAEIEKKAEEDAGGTAGGELLYCGGTNWETMGRKATAAAGNLVLPTRLRSLVGVDIRVVASGCSSCHCVALDVEGRCYTWGRNEKGQLGHGDIRHRYLPAIIHGLSEYKIVGAAAGRNHTVVITDEGKGFSFGLNKHGQLGTGSAKNEIETYPVPCMVSHVTNVACGADFSVWLSSEEGSSILTAGLPQYGQLGHGTDNEYNTKDSSVKLAYEAQPRPRAIAAFSDKTITKVACGANHTVAVDSNGFVYTWGFGGYGRLGHREQKDEWVPRLVEVFQRHNVLPPDAVVAAGSVSSACTAGGGQLYMWGKLKTTGDEWMYPKPVMDLRSSANPKKVDVLDGMRVTSVACGLGLSLIVVDRKNVGDRLDKLEIYDGGTAAETEENNVSGVGNTSDKVNANSSSKRKKQEDSSEEYGDEGTEGDESEEEINGESGSQRSQRGRKSATRGRGAKRTAPEAKSSGRGRGRPRSQEKDSSSRGRGRGRKQKSR